MKSIKSLKSLVKRKTNAQEVSKSGWKMKPFLALMCTALLIFWYKTTNIQFEQTEIEETDYPFDMAKESEAVNDKLKGLPRGIIQSRSDLELKPLWSRGSLRSKGVEMTNRNLLAIPVGLKQKGNVDALVKKVLLFLLELILILGIEEEQRIPLNVKLLCLSFFPRISRLFFSIMMEIWINGGIWSGVQNPYI
jgi:hypothetical protein